MTTELESSTLVIGQDLSKKTIEELQQLYDKNLNNPNIDPRLLKELKMYIQFKTDGGLSWIGYCLTHFFGGHIFGDLGVDDENYYQRLL